MCDSYWKDKDCKGSASKMTPKMVEALFDGTNKFGLRGMPCTLVIRVDCKRVRHADVGRAYSNGTVAEGLYSSMG